MTAGEPRPPCVLAVHPASYGFGWVAFRGPFTPYDWGSVSIGKDKNELCIERFEELLHRFMPETLVMEAFEPHESERQERITDLCRRFVGVSANHGVLVAIYKRGEVTACFANVGAKTRDDVALAVVRYVDDLKHWLPRKRQSWDSEQHQMAIFSAAAVGLAHYQLDKGQLFEGIDWIA